MKKLTLQANAKINLTLGVLGKRADGYHELDTIMQSVSLCDRLTAERAEGIAVTCSDSALSGDGNLAFRAAQIFFEETGVRGGVRLEIEKNIPPAAGLAGGSADAAAALLALDRLYGTGIPYEELCRIALRLGADVPFFLKGGTQRAEGIGERLTPLPALRTGCFLLVKAGSKPSTAEMYRRLDRVPFPRPDTEQVIAALRQGDLERLAAGLQNSFSAAWPSDRAEELLKTTAPLGVSLSGSGPVRFALYAAEADAKAAEKVLAAQNVFCCTALPCDCGVRMV